MGRCLSPIQAAQIGLAQVLAPERALDAAGSWPRASPINIRRRPRESKQLIRGAATRPLAEGVAAEREAFHALLREDETLARLHALNRGERGITPTERDAPSAEAAAERAGFRRRRDRGRPRSARK